MWLNDISTNANVYLSHTIKVDILFNTYPKCYKNYKSGGLNSGASESKGESGRMGLKLMSKA